MQFHNETEYIVDGMTFTKRELFDRCLETYWFKMTFHLLIGILIILLAFPNMLLIRLIRGILFVIVIVNIIIFKLLLDINFKIERILNNAQIITTNLVLNMCKRRVKYYLLNGEYFLYSIYYDSQNERSIPFYYKGHVDRPVHIMQPFKKGESIRDLKTIKVLVNSNDYSEYFVLFREELNIDMSRDKYYQMMNWVNYVIFYGFIITLVVLGN